MGMIVGGIIVVICTFGGYVALGGKLAVLWQPFEVVIICGSAMGAYIIANPPAVLKGTLGTVGKSLKGNPYSKKDYLELLSVLYQVLKLARTKGALAIERHVESPDDSELFAQFPSFNKNTKARNFLCDYLRLITLGADNPHEMEALMDEELETKHVEKGQIANALQTVADGLPALGIVAAVLGVIKTMGSITEPPEVLGHLIGGALVGTFLGVWIAYGFVGPLASKVKALNEAEAKYYDCMKATLIAHMGGSAPAVSVEFGRKMLFSGQRPTFYEVEQAVEDLPAAA